MLGFDFGTPVLAQRRQDRGLAQRLVSLLTPGAAQLMVHPIDEAYLFQDRAGTIPVTADGQVVGRILDAGGGGYHLTAVSDPARGTFRRSGRHRWIEFNGTNTAYQTAALPAPGVDKAQVFAAVRKLGNTVSGGMISELSPNANGSNGAWRLTPGSSATGAGPFYSAASRGTALAQSDTAGGYAPPVSNTLAMSADISGARVTLRINGAQAALSTASQGSGNFNPSGTYPLNVGSRNGASLFFNGNHYGALITRLSGANLSVETITAVETLLAAEIAGAP